MTSRPRSKPAHARAIWSVPLPLRVAIIIVAVALVYLPALHADFVWDDELLITANPLLRDLSGLVEIWTGGRTADYYPLTNTIFWIEWHLFGQQAAGYHAVNIVLQIANALLVWLVVRRFHVPGAWLAGLIFGIHPVHAESVTWISELKNLLSMFFGILSVLCFLEIGDKRLLATPAAYFGSLVFFALAVLSKTHIVFLPLVLAVCAWWRARRRSLKAKTIDFAHEAVRIAPFFLIAVVLGWVTIWFQNRGLGSEEVFLGSLNRRLANAGLAVWWYAEKLFLPVRLMPIYPNWRFDPPDWFEWLPLLALVGILAAAWRWREGRMRGAFFAVSYFVIALVPVLGFLQMSYVRSGTLVADHYQYFADVSLIALFCAGIAKLWAWQKSQMRIATAAVVFLLLGAMGTYTWTRAEVYRNEETLWQDNLSKNSDAWQAHNRLGQRFFNQEKYVEAAPHFELAAQLKPELADNYNQLGLVYCRLGRFEEGIAEYRKGLRLKEAKSSTANDAGTAKMEANLANALTITAINLTETAQIFPRDTSAIAAAQADEGRRRYGEAVQAYEKALELDPRQPAVHRNLGILLVRLGRYDEAVIHLRATLQLVPNEPLARETLDAIEAQRR